MVQRDYLPEGKEAKAERGDDPSWHTNLDTPTMLQRINTGEKMNLEAMKNMILDRSIFEPNSGCWLWEGKPDANGYGQVGIGGKNLKPHRISFAAFNGSPDGLCICHRCDVRICVNPDHLFAGTQADNMRDMDKKGRRVSVRGEESPQSKLTAAQIVSIREIYAKGASSLRSLAKDFGVGQTVIFAIIKKRKWKHI